MRTTREPRTLFMERAANFLHIRGYDVDTKFQKEASAFRHRWGLPEDGFNLAELQGWPDLPRTIHEFLLTFARSQRGEVTTSEAAWLTLLLPNPFEQVGKPNVREELNGLGFDHALIGRLQQPEELPDFFAYEADLNTFIARWVRRYQHVEELGIDAPDLIKDLIYIPDLLLDRLAREYRWFDFIREPQPELAPLLHTFTVILPDASLGLARDVIPVPVDAQEWDPVTQLPRIDPATGKGVYRNVELPTYGLLQPVDVYIHTRVGIPVNGVKELAAEVARAIRTREGLFSHLAKRRRKDVRVQHEEDGPKQVDAVTLSIALARIHAGASRAAVIKELADKYLQDGRALGDSEIDRQLRDAEARFIPRE